MNMSFSLSLDVWKHLPLNVLSDLYLHLVFHPLISCDDMVLVSERLTWPSWNQRMEELEVIKVTSSNSSSCR